MEPRKTTQVVIFTKNFRINGEISLFSQARLTDYMNKADRYVAVTNATVFSHDGDKLETTDFLDINQDKIEIIIPADEVV